MQILALDIGGTEIKHCVIQGGEYEQCVVRATKAPMLNASDFFGCLDGIVAEYNEAIQGIAISACMPLDADKGLVLFGGSYTFLNNIYLRREMEQRYNLPVSIEKDSNCSLLSEIAEGALQNTVNSAVFVIGTGLGLGIQINGTIYRGAHDLAGEASLDFYTESNSLSELAILRYNAPSLIQRIATAVKKPVANGFEAFSYIHNNNPAALQQLQEYARSFARVLVNYQNLFDFEKIAISGGISREQTLISAVSTYFKWYYEEILPIRQVPIIPVVASRFGNMGNLIGAYQVFEKQHRNLFGKRN